MWKSLVGVTLLFLTDGVLCKPDYIFYHEVNGWLSFHAVPATWQQAFLNCRYEACEEAQDAIGIFCDLSKAYDCVNHETLLLKLGHYGLGAVLASPINAELVTALRNIMSKSKLDSPIFVRVNSFVKRIFTSIEGVPLSDLSITWGSYGDGKTPEDCLTLSTDGKTYISSCTLSLPYICYKQRDNTTIPNRCGSFDDDYRYNHATGSCYKYHPQRQTWNIGYAICAAEGGHLVIINNQREADIVGGLLTLNAMHIGLRDWNNDSTWLSIHGEKIEDLFNTWYSSYPKTPYASYPCAILTPQRTLQNEYCDHPSQHWFPFVCEKDPSALRFQKICREDYEDGTEPLNRKE